MSKKKIKPIPNIEPSEPIAETAVDKLLSIIQRHAANVTNTKMFYLQNGPDENYMTYANIEAAFDLLIEDIKKEGFVF